MIKIIPHKNFILFSLIYYSSINPKDKGYKFPLSEKILKDLSSINNLSQIKLLEKHLTEGLINKNIFRYLRLALYTDDNLEPEGKKYGHYSYGNSVYTMYQKYLKKIFQDIKKDIHYDEYYEKSILPQYTIICKNLQPFFNKNNFSKEFNSFWKLPFKPKLFVIPNVFSSQGGFATTKPKKYYSQTGTYLNKKNHTYEFIPEKVWFNSVHEFCHSAFKDSLVQTNNFKNYLELSEEKFKPIKNEIPEKILRTYNTGYAYFEDTFIRACRIKILENYYKRTNPNLDIKSFVEDSIKKQEIKNGFKFVNNFYKMLTSEEQILPADVYIKTLKNLEV